jgi:hypothetical protein
MGLCPKPRVWGELIIFRRKKKHRKKKILDTPFDFGAARARARPWVKNPLVDWACSFLLDPMRILHHALSKFDMRR